ncbi:MULTISPECIES: membrane-associated oxidoreductase [Pseudomonas]|uniref:membrane-associated oxidoreductase n=1 Tax=Pseudomonas TaxID=286 RepID=UPI001E574C99|nr:membrane-associated oxidoreductase [Pseudomonas iridis]
MEDSLKLLGRLKDSKGRFRPAEQRLLDCFKQGVITRIGETLPDASTDENVVRAIFLRSLILTYSKGAFLGEYLQLQGAFIEGPLFLVGITVSTPVVFEKCRFEKDLNVRGAIFDHLLKFEDCALKSFLGERLIVNNALSFISTNTEGVVELTSARISASLKCTGSQFDGGGKESLNASFADIRTSVSLSGGFSAKGLVRFRSAEIGGQFNCQNGSFVVETGQALDLDCAVINGPVFLRNGFSSQGIVNLLGARILGQLSCRSSKLQAIGGGEALILERAFIRGNALFREGCEINGRLHISGLEVEGNIEFDGASIQELMANEVRVRGTLCLRKLKPAPTEISFLGASVTTINDDLDSWGERPILNGFIYDSVDIHKPMRVSERMTWLKKQKSCLKKDETSPLSPAEHFRPQPWRQLQQVLDSMGHTEEAKEVGIEYEHCLRRFGRIGQSPKSWNYFFRGLYSCSAKLLHFLYGYLTAFGYRPMLLLPWFALVWGFCTLVYWDAASDGVFAPSNPLIFQNEAYETCRPDRETVWLKKRHDRLPIELPEAFRGPGNWYLCGALREEYTGFSPIAFSLDLLLPLVDLHQENDWAPLIETPKSNWLAEMRGLFSAKRWVRFVMWCEILAGWGFSLLFVAVVSGLARRKE